MRVVQKFFVASMFMWAIPIAILYAFNHNMLPGKILMYLSLYGFLLFFWSGFLLLSLISFGSVCLLSTVLFSRSFSCDYFNRALEENRRR